MPRLSFEVSVPPDPTRQRVVVVGTDPALGNWRPERGLELDKESDGKFRGMCDLPYGLIEFKVTRGTWDTEESYADGTPVLNYLHLMAHDLDLAIDVEHWKDSPPRDHELIWGKAIDVELDGNLFEHHRKVIVWLPPGYLASETSRHPVLYVFDGQDAIAAMSTPDNETLAVDDWVRKLARAKLIPEIIVVGVCHREAFGQRDEELSPQCDGRKMADFLVHDLKPFIDYTFCRERTHHDAPHNGILGFGLGGTLALWMATRYSDTFGKYGCQSPYYEDLSADRPEECELVRELRIAKKFHPNGVRMYFDHGTLGADANIVPYQERINAALKERGFVEGRDFSVNVAVGSEHTLTAWRARLGAGLQFLFGR